MDKGINKIKLYTVAIIFTLSTGFSFYGIKMCIPYGDTLTLLAFRYTAALIAVGIWLLALRVLGMSPERPKGRPKKNLYCSACFYVLFMIFQIFGLYFATSIEGAIVFAFGPVFTKIIARIFLGERSTKLQLIFVTITVTSVIIMIVLNATDITMSIPGMLLMLLSSLCMSCSNVFTRYIRGTFKPIEITTHIVILGFIVFNGANIARHIAAGNLNEYFEPVTHGQFAFWISFLGIFCILLTAQFMSYMLSRMQVLQSTIWGNASTVVTICVGALLLGEPLQWFHILCGILVLTGVIGLSLAPAPSENDGKKMSDKK